ncbi:hypothetical protein M899_1550 [Bacteriovorax sp. BSW11_IV]|uniref:hypothetical protein n=1 Tax=Bacteriovorax sp. BSW11_IV TaxID=1353529 RepID=UPI00038A5035|nr:hypothetical protein [Bacteriovorax sp. BSW11_IV]EQC49321.1 hypothetical protein M899_1550 [Bacteriovorax sp. BSW11_IV]
MKIRQIFLPLFLSLTFLLSSPAARAEVDPKLKALGAMAAYGTVGGALLGTASLAFGTKGRSVAIGASLGLYAGLIFGGYVVMTHAMKKRGYQQGGGEYYPDAPAEVNPYENAPQGYFQDGGNNQGLLMHELKMNEDFSSSVKVALNKQDHSDQKIGFELLNIQF